MSILGIPGEVSVHQMASHFPSLPMWSRLWVHGEGSAFKASDSALLAHLQRHRGMVMSVEPRWDAAGQCWRRERQRGTVGVGGTEQGTHAHGGLGWRPDLPRSSYQRFSQAWGRPTAPLERLSG
ncbi:MAG TPA: hypothetical protein VF026_16955 [Ktedonobacteraceae bacterium]